MYVLFGLLPDWLGARAGYLAAFLVYWLGWCGLLPLALLGRRGFAGLFSRPSRPLGRPAWLSLLCLGLPLLFAYGHAFPRLLPRATALVVAASAAIAAVNASGEEVLWRGLYVRAFPGSRVLGWLWPTLGFALWHLGPLRVFPNRNPGGAWSFVAFCAGLGLLWGWVARSSGSVRWTTVAHALFDAAGLGALVYFGRS
jgi:membrane protease YdiL (CAAX protease family)